MLAHIYVPCGIVGNLMRLLSQVPICSDLRRKKKVSRTMSRSRKRPLNIRSIHYNVRIDSNSLGRMTLAGPSPLFLHDKSQRFRLMPKDLYFNDCFRFSTYFARALAHNTFRILRLRNRRSAKKEGSEEKNLFQQKEREREFFCSPLTNHGWGF